MAFTIRPYSGCTLAVTAKTGRKQNASGSDPACLPGITIWLNGEKGVPSSALWNTKSTTRHEGLCGHPLHPPASPATSTLSCWWIHMVSDKRVSEADDAHFSPHCNPNYRARHSPHPVPTIERSSSSILVRTITFPRQNHAQDMIDKNAVVG